MQNKINNDNSLEEAGGYGKKDTIAIKPHKREKKKTELYENGGG